MLNSRGAHLVNRFAFGRAQRLLSRTIKKKFRYRIFPAPLVKGWFLYQSAFGIGKPLYNYNSAFIDLPSANFSEDYPPFSLNL